MTERKPPFMSWESWTEQQIREAQERGEFDNLEGTGKPIIGVDEVPDDLWWVKKKLAREGVSVTPPTLAVRKARDDLLASIVHERSETKVRAALAALNERIREINRKVTAGPPSTVMLLDVDAVVS